MRRQQTPEVTPARRRLPVRWLVLGGTSALCSLILLGQQWWIARGPGQLRRPVAVVELDPADLNRRLDEAQRLAMTPALRCRRLALRDLGLVAEVEPRADAPGLVERLWPTPRVPAFYAQGRDTIYTVDRHAPSVRHEWVHAWEDQHGDRMRRAESASTDEQIGLRAVIEGTAMAVTHTPGLGVRWFPDLDAAAWSLAYGLGPGYVARRTGDALAAGVAIRPVTTYDVLFDRRSTTPASVTPMERDSAQSAATPGHPLTGEAPACSDRLGPLAVLVAGLQAGLPEGDALSTARSWAGDTVVVRVVPAGRRVAWTVLFRDQAAVQQFARTTNRAPNLAGARVLVYGSARPGLR